MNYRDAIRQLNRMSESDLSRFGIKPGGVIYISPGGIINLSPTPLWFWL